MHPYFDPSFKHEFEKEFGFTHSLPPKQKSKFILTPNITPEPTSYMKIYNLKKSPKYKSPSKHSEESIKLKKQPQYSTKSNEKSYFFPDISKKAENFKRKKSTKYLQKLLEVHTDPKNSLKSTDAIQPHKIDKNPSLEHDFSIDNIIKSSFASSILSNRNQNLSRKEASQHTPDQLPNISFLPSKYRLKKYDNMKTPNSKSIIMSFNNFSPKNK